MFLAIKARRTYFKAIHQRAKRKLWCLFFSVFFKSPKLDQKSLPPWSRSQSWKDPKMTFITFLLELTHKEHQTLILKHCFSRFVLSLSLFLSHKSILTLTHTPTHTHTQTHALAHKCTNTFSFAKSCLEGQKSMPGKLNFQGEEFWMSLKLIRIPSTAAALIYFLLFEVSAIFE